MKAYERALFNEFKNLKKKEINKFQLYLIEAADEIIARTKEDIVNLVTNQAENILSLEEQKTMLVKMERLKVIWLADVMMFDENETRDLLGSNIYGREIMPVYYKFLCSLEK